MRLQHRLPVAGVFRAVVVTVVGGVILVLSGRLLLVILIRRSGLLRLLLLLRRLLRRLLITLLWLLLGRLLIVLLLRLVAGGRGQIGIGAILPLIGLRRLTLRAGVLVIVALASGKTNHQYQGRNHQSDKGRYFAKLAHKCFLREEVWMQHFWKRSADTRLSAANRILGATTAQITELSRTQRSNLKALHPGKHAGLSSAPTTKATPLLPYRPDLLWDVDLKAALDSPDWNLTASIISGRRRAGGRSAALQLQFAQVEEQWQSE